VVLYGVAVAVEVAVEEVAVEVAVVSMGLVLSVPSGVALEGALFTGVSSSFCVFSMLGEDSVRSLKEEATAGGSVRGK
jgi:hypothetical protein